MTEPASESCGFCICCISSFIPPQVKRQSENVRFSSLSRCCNWSTGHGGAVPAWKIKPACPRWLPPNKIHSFAFPCCNLALLSHTHTLHSLSAFSLSFTISVPHPCIFSAPVLAVPQGLERGRGREEGRQRKQRQRGSVDSGLLSGPPVRGWGGLVGICVSAFMPGGLFTLAATVTAGASQWINLGLLNKYSLQWN